MGEDEAMVRKQGNCLGTSHQAWNVDNSFFIFFFTTYRTLFLFFVQIFVFSFCCANDLKKKKKVKKMCHISYRLLSIEMSIVVRTRNWRVLVADGDG